LVVAVESIMVAEEGVEEEVVVEEEEGGDIECNSYWWSLFYFEKSKICAVHLTGLFHVCC
jgi:hypothetical protein